MKSANEFMSEAIARLKARKAFLAQMNKGHGRLKRETGWGVGLPAKFGVLLEGNRPVGLFNANYAPVDILYRLSSGLTFNEALFDPGPQRCDWCGRARLFAFSDRPQPCHLCQFFQMKGYTDCPPNQACAGWCGLCCCCGAAVASLVANQPPDIEIDLPTLKAAFQESKRNSMKAGVAFARRAFASAK